jgi:hypothetical protein
MLTGVVRARISVLAAVETLLSGLKVANVHHALLAGRLAPTNATVAVMG